MPQISSTQAVGNAGVGYGSGPSGTVSSASQAAIAGQAGNPAYVIVYELN
jgi:hypothetical protein